MLTSWLCRPSNRSSFSALIITSAHARSELDNGSHSPGGSVDALAPHRVVSTLTVNVARDAVQRSIVEATDALKQTGSEEGGALGLSQGA